MLGMFGKINLSNSNELNFVFLTACVFGLELEKINNLRPPSRSYYPFAA